MKMLDIPFADIGLIETIFINKLLPHFNVHHKGFPEVTSCRTARVKREIQIQVDEVKDWRVDSCTSIEGIRELKKEASAWALVNTGT